jgi:DNA primase
VAFGARALEKDAQPKYLNSPETAIYRKSKILYGLHRAREALRNEQSLFIVEGYMDYLALYQHGITNVAATSGTALTEQHGQLLQRFTHSCVLLFDGDEAGITAAQRAVFTLAPFALDVSILVLPDNEDPDSYLNGRGKEAFLALAANAQAGLDFLIARALKQFGTTTPRGKAAAADFVVPYLVSISDDVIRAESIHILAQRLTIDERLIYGKLPKSKQTRSTHMQKTDDIERYLGTNEGRFITLLLSQPSLIPEAEQYILPETITDQFTSNVYSIIRETYREHQTIQNLIGRVNDPFIQRIIASVGVNPSSEEHAADELAHTILRLREKFLRNRMKTITELLKNNSSDKNALLAEHKDISEQLKLLDAH